MRLLGNWWMRLRSVKPSEHEEQVWFFQACAVRERFDWRYALPFAVPNGARTSMSTARKLKSEGLKAGVPDVIIPVPVGDYNGAAIEFKRKGNRPSDKQMWWLKALELQGYKTTIQYTGADAFQWLENYLAGKI